MATESEPQDATEEYDAKHGRPTEKDTQQPSGLTEAGNKPPGEHVSFRVTTK